MAKFDPGWEGYPVSKTGLPAFADHPTYHVNVIKLKREIIWTGRLPHLSELPHLRGPPPPCKQGLKDISLKGHNLIRINSLKMIIVHQCLRYLGSYKVRIKQSQF